MKEKHSKRILIIISSISLVLLMIITAACAKPAPTPAPAPVPAPTQAPAQAPAQAKTITLTFTSPDPPDGFLGKDFLQPWFAELEERSGGKVKMEAHWNGELVPLPEAYDAVVKGTIDIAQHLTTMPAGKFPMDDIGSFTSYDLYCPRRSRVFWELHQKFTEMQEAYRETKLLCVIEMYPFFLCTTKKAGPVRTLEDNKGLKQIAFGKLQGARGEALGRIPTSVLPPDTYMSLEKGVVDCWQPNINMVRDFGVGELLPYITMVPGPGGPFTFPINLDTWNSLPADVQKIMDEMSGELVDNFDEVMLQEARECIASYPQDYGTEFIVPSQEELARWVEVDKPVKEEFVSEIEALGLPGNDLIEEFLSLEKKYAVSWEEFMGK